MAKAMRKMRTGHVVRIRMDKTAIVEMVWKQRHRLYQKQVRRVARFYVHDPLSECTLGDTVRIEETRPISKNKHWRLLEVLGRRQVAEVRPSELEADAELSTEERDDEIVLETDGEQPVAEQDEVLDLEAEEPDLETEKESQPTEDEEDEVSGQ